MLFRSKQGLCLRFIAFEEKVNSQLGHPSIICCDYLHSKTVKSNQSILLNVLNVFIKH